MSLRRILKKIAPVLGGTIGGPLGMLATTFLSEKLGVDESALEETVLKSNPETLLKIKTLDAEFKSKMAELGLREKELHANDRASARDMASKTTLLPQAILSGIFITGFVVIMFLVFTGETQLEGTMKDTAIYLLGILSAGVTQIMNFFFGSSAGSKNKTFLNRDK